MGRRSIRGRKACVRVSSGLDGVLRKAITMVGWGIILLILGVGSILMPLLNMQFGLRQIFGPGNEWFVGIIMTAAGLLLIVLGLRRGRTNDVDARKRS